jgi:hypothetical protein
MLLRTLKNGARALFAGRTPAAGSFPLEEEERLNWLHARAGLERHQDILFEGVRVGAEPFAALYRRCLQQTGTPLTPASALRRFQSRFSLVQYFLHSLAIEGARAEVGVYRGATALLLAHAARARDPAYRGRDLYLLDSFAGASESGAADLIPVREPGGAARMHAFFPAGVSDTSPELVRGFFREFPEVEIVEGWIPQVFASLPQTRWAFVHLDVTLHDPTLAALEYFHPRLARGGVIVVDGYGSPFCPGLKRAWDAYCARHGLAFAVLAQQQAVLFGT